MLELLKDILPKILGYLAPFIIRLYYKVSRIDEGIKIRVRSDGEGVTYNCGELASIRIWLELCNLTPFTIEFDRMYGQVLLGNCVGDFAFLQKNTLDPAHEKSILIEIFLNEAQTKHIRVNQNKTQTTIILGAFINCKIHDLTINRNIKTNNTNYINCLF